MLVMHNNKHKTLGCTLSWKHVLKKKQKWSSPFPSGLKTDSHVQPSPELTLQHLSHKEWWLQLNLHVSQFEEFHMVQPVGKTKMIITILPQDEKLQNMWIVIENTKKNFGETIKVKELQVKHFCFTTNQPLECWLLEQHVITHIVYFW